MLNFFSWSDSLIIYSIISVSQSFCRSYDYQWNKRFHCRFHTWISTVVQNLIIKSLCVSNRQKKYRDLFGITIQLATTQIIGTFSGFVEHWEPLEPYTLSPELPSDKQNEKVLQRTGLHFLSTNFHPVKGAIAVKTEL